MKIRFKYLTEDRDRHGNVRLYFRRNGKKIRLRGTPGCDEFLAEYASALADSPINPGKQMN
jgi:hypothetical protein